IEDWYRIIDVNLRGVVNGVAAAYRVMLPQGVGKHRQHRIGPGPCTDTAHGELRCHETRRRRTLEFAADRGCAGWHPGERALAGSHSDAAPARRPVRQGPAPRLRGTSARVLRAVAAHGSDEIRTQGPDTSRPERCAHHRARLVPGDVVAQSSLT